MSDVATWLPTADRSSDWSGVSATVAGLGGSGFAAADALLRVGARVTVLEAKRPGPDDDVLLKRADVLDTLGATVHLGATNEFVVAGDLLVPSPGLSPMHPWIVTATTRTTWSGEQLAWQLRPASTPWLTVTGTNGKTTTVQLAATMLQAAGLRPLAAGNIGLPMAEAIFVEPQPEVFVVELSSYQLHFTPSLSATASALLNIAPDHLDWHGSLADYVRDKSRVFHGTQKAIVYNHDDRRVEELAEEADVVEGCRAIGFTLGIPERSMVGIVDGVLVDRAFIAERASHAVELVALDELPDGSPPVVADTLAAAALVRSFGAPVEPVRSGALSFEVDEHRGETVDVLDGVAYVDNSKATNAHAADTALSATDHVVWIAGGLAKGGDFEGLVRRHRGRLRGVVLIGVDQEPLREAFRRHAPEVPLIAVPAGDTDPMRSAVGAAAALAQRHDTVLLAPACASMDQFVDYRARGRAFAEAVAHLRR